MPEAFSEPCQISEMELFAKIVNDFEPLLVFSLPPRAKICPKKNLQIE